MNGEEDEEKVGWIWEKVGGEVMGVEGVEDRWKMRGKVRGRELGV